MNKQKISFLMAVLLAVSLFFVANITYIKAANKQKNDGWGTLKLEKSEETVAEKIDIQLRKHKRLKLKVYAGRKASQKIISDVKEKIKKVNRYGVVFQHDGGKKRKGFYEYHITTENARLYDRSILFFEKIYKKVKTGYKKEEFKDSDSDYNPVSAYKMKKNDYEKFRNGKELRLHIIYDFFVMQASRGQKSIGNTERTTKDIYAPSLKYVFGENSELDYTVLADKYLVKSRTNELVNLKSYDEFVAEIKDVDSFVEKYEFIGTEPYTDSDYLVMNHDFYELSDAMKIYVIDKSKYFNLHDSNAGFGMDYSYAAVGESYHRTDDGAMKALLDNKAIGVCIDFARYTSLIFKQLDIETYYVSKDEINHAFSVVKVKNSKGKVLWIPFDYGIGPAKMLAVDYRIYDKYLKTEEMRYKLYLSGIKGAPNYKNFTFEDFN